MVAIPELLESAAQATPIPAAPPLSSTPAPTPTPRPTPEVIPVQTLAPPPVRAPEVEAYAMTAAPTSEPLFTVKVWQLGFAVIAVMLAALYTLGIL